MPLFNLVGRKKDDPKTLERTIHIEGHYNPYSVMQAMEAKLLVELTHKLADKIIDDIYDEVLESVNKDTIVREVSLKVSEEILAKIFSKGDEKNEKL